MVIAMVLGVGAAWVLLAVVVALLLGRTVRVADQRRPRTVKRSARRRAASAFERVVEVATGAIPIIRPHALD